MLFRVFLLIVVAYFADAVTVSTTVGKISGYTETVIADGHPQMISKFMILMNIPYAEAASGHNRFGKPIPKAPFVNTFMASGKPIGCIQASIEETQQLLMYTNFSEDCLILNVYVPHDFTGNVTLPVMVWIHGGGFRQGASGIYLADLLNAYGNAIVVTINYRLGMFGFLQSADGKLPGNQGLWDQHLALKWIHENIAAFTGDPNQVTIFGQSAGAASVLYQALYPGNKGYFQRVIAESGSPLADWAISTGPNAEVFIEKVGCNSSLDPVVCLRMKTPVQLQLPTSEDENFRPAIDGDFILESPEETFFGNNPKSAPAREFYTSLDILSGINNYDGALNMLSVWPNLIGYTNINSPRITRDQFQNIVIRGTVDGLLKPKDNITRTILENVVSFVYTNWTDPGSFVSTRTSTVKISSDVGFFSPAIRAAKAHATAGKGHTYFYEFGVDVEQHIFATPDWIKGSNHGDEISYLFCEPLFIFTTKNFTEDDKLVSRAVATMWSNFAKSGNPNRPEDVTKYIHTTWPEFSVTSQEYFEISYKMSESSVKNHFHTERMTLWAELIPSIKRLSEQRSDHVSNIPGLIVGK